MRPLRVGLVCPYAFGVPGGVQNHVLGLAGYLRGHGHHAEVLGPGQLAPDSEAGAWFTSAGSAVPLPYNGSVARISFGPLVSARVGRWLSAGRFDLLHLHEPLSPSVSLHALRAATAPVVATFHAATPRSVGLHLAGGVLSRLVDRIDLRIAVSECARAVVRRHVGADAEVVPNGFRYADFAGAPLPGPGPGWRGGPRPRLAFLGRLDEPRKGLDVLLQALPAIRAAVGDLEVVVAGTGRPRVPGGVRVWSDPDDAERTRLLAGSDVFVAPQLSRESFGIVLLEAMASGAAVVASDLPAFTALLGTGPGALGGTFPAGDPAGLAAAVVDTLRRPDPVARHRARRSTRRFDWSVVGAALLERYRGLAVADRSGRELPWPT